MGLFIYYIIMEGEGDGGCQNIMEYDKGCRGMEVNVGNVGKSIKIGGGGV